MKHPVLVVILSSLASLATGGCAGYFLAKKKFDAVLNRAFTKDVNDLKNHDEWVKGLSDDTEKPSEVKSNSPIVVTPNTVDNADRLEEERKYHTIVNKNYAPTSVDAPVLKKIDPYIVSDDEVNSSDYDLTSIYLHKDNKFADSDDNLITDPELLDMLSALNITYDKFGKKRSTAIYIRDDAKQMDYEVLKSTDKWVDIATPAQRQAALSEVEEDDDD